MKRSLLAPILLLAAGSALAGSLDPAGTPADSGTWMPSLSQLYDRLRYGSNAAPLVVQPPAQAPASDGAPTVDDLMLASPSTRVDAVLQEDVRLGQVYWSLDAAAWGVRTGALPDRAFNPARLAIERGYYGATNLTEVDPDLRSSNLVEGVVVFGVTGSIPALALSAETNALAYGIYPSSQLHQVETELVPTNIRSGVTVFGVVGSVTAPDDRTLSPHTPMLESGLYGATNLNRVELDLSPTNMPEGVAVFGVTGSIPSLAFSATTEVFLAGLYSADSLTNVDTDLTATNMRSGTSMFGVTGTMAVALFTNAPLLRTGQTTSRGANDDGVYGKGLFVATNRFVTYTNDVAASNCVLDTATGLMWVRTVNSTHYSTWTGALAYCEVLDGTAGRGGYTDWRLPNLWELFSLVDAEKFSPALPAGHPFFPAAPSITIWTSGTSLSETTKAWTFSLAAGGGGTAAKTVATYYIWPVRGGYQ